MEELITVLTTKKQKQYLKDVEQWKGRSTKRSIKL